MITEKDAWSMNGFVGVFVIVILLSVGIYNFFYEQVLIGIIFSVIGIILITGLTLVQPNQAAVIMFFGKYVGSIRKEGFIITSVDKKKISTVEDIRAALENKKGGVLIEGVYPSGRSYYGLGM